MTKEQIKNLYDIKEFRDIPDHYLAIILGDDFPEWEKLENEDDELQKIIKDSYNKWRSELKQVRKEVEEFKKEMDAGDGKLKLLYLKNKKNNLNQLIIDEVKYQDKMKRLKIPEWFQQISKNRLKKYIDEYNKINKQIEYLKNPPSDNSITPEMIEFANNYPIEELDELITVKRGKAYCPFHDDKKPSMSVTGNIFHCFGCGEKGNTITFVMKMTGLDFVGAVKYINKRV